MQETESSASRGFFAVTSKSAEMNNKNIKTAAGLFAPQPNQLPTPPAAWANLTVVSVVFLIGLSFTLLLYRHFVNLDQERIEDRVLRGVQTLAAYSVSTPPNPNMLDAFAVLGRMQQDLLQTPVLDQNILQSYVWTPPSPAEDRINLRYHPRVSYNATSNSYDMLNLKGEVEPFVIPIMDTDPAGVRPATPRDEYYPVLLEATGGIQFVNPVGLNHFYDDSFHIALDQARDSGFVTSRTSFPQANDNELYLISSFFVPLYTPGASPTTIDERRKRHTGFLSAFTYGPAKSYINFLPESYQGLDTVFFSDSPAFSADQHDDGLRAALANDLFAHETFETNNLKTHIFARASYNLRQSMQTPNRWWALGIGTITTTWICSLLLLLRKNSRDLSQLVEQRTRTLVDRTRKLGEANTALSDSEGRYRMLADNVSDVIFTTDANGICTYISPSIAQQNGFTPEDYLGKPIFSHATPTSALTINQFMQSVKADPDTFNFDDHYEFETLCKNGAAKPVEISLTKLANIEGNYSGVLGVARDISDRKKAEREKTALQDAFRQSQKMEAIGTLAGGVAHDFNNLLTGILGHAELAKAHKGADPGITSSLNVIETAALRAKELTSQLLGFARKGQMQTKAVAINSLVQETVALLDRTIDKNIKIQTTLSHLNLVVNGDPAQMSQILLNLAVNARDAMPDGGKLTFATRSVKVDEHFTYTHYEELKPGTYCLVTVTDSGIGIAKEKLNRIFEPFFTDKPDGQGTGLGLAMVYGVTKNHGGTVTVYSEVGIGTVFKVYLPLAEAVSETTEVEVSSHPVAGKGTVLVVDDEAIVRNMAEAMLSKLGYNVILATDGLEALKYYHEHWSSINLVLLDMIMPNMGGRECLQRMQAINPDIKAIISTGFAPDDFISQIASTVNFGFLQKPYRLRDLSEIVASTLNA